MTKDLKALFVGLSIGLIMCASYAAGFYGRSAHEPRLVGIKCAGAQGPLYAYEEDEFPVCAEIRKR